ncbi:uncharacterized protein EV420DRAFT_1482683 [Desarmillaria tabescens]|uniref:Uncharacterized protein n=1 Tax=Armillaria tabescens TaxID=1929756 RepID=A0AA39JZ82_ARMTA|nr:uncharacterized protein EV420DRAFT_1482683 [Desarmillaria tabescens]KAK0450476.1 hypothetical protein EV420DRAFT_1482683 [Desarmillaria tabescens]
MGCKIYPDPLALDTGIPPEQFQSLLVSDHYILLRQAHARYPALVNMNTLATYLQPEIKSMLDSVHPFLAAHESYFPKDRDTLVICFLATMTALANNLSLAFQSVHWEVWKVVDPTRMFQLLGFSKPRFDPDDTFPGEVIAPMLPGLPTKRNHFQVAPEEVFRQGLRWQHFQDAASSAWFANLGDHYLLLRLAHTRYPQVLDSNILVNWCQPEVADLINHVHPFLLAHANHFPDDTDALALRFLMTVTTVAITWDLVSSTRIGLLGCDLHFPGDQDPVILSDHFPGSTGLQYTSDLPFFQVGIGCYPMDLDKLPSAIADALRLLSQAGVYPIHLPAWLFSCGYTWSGMGPIF